MSTTTINTTTADTNRTTVGERHELGRYTTPTDGERILYGQRINGKVRLVDVPADGHGRAYVVERELEQDGHAALQALVTDYLDQAGKFDAIPLAVNPVDRYLEQVT